MDLAARACIVIPCFNEAARLDTDSLTALADHPSVRLLFVDDGSTDDTGAALAKLAAANESIEVLTLATNVGKAEAVRRGMVAALRTDAALIGYYDADLATPPDEMVRLIEVLTDTPDAELRHGLTGRAARNRDPTPSVSPLRGPRVCVGRLDRARHRRVRHAVRRQGIPARPGARSRSE